MLQISKSKIFISFENDGALLWGLEKCAVESVMSREMSGGKKLGTENKIGPKHQTRMIWIKVARKSFTCHLCHILPLSNVRGTYVCIFPDADTCVLGAHVSVCLCDYVLAARPDRGRDAMRRDSICSACRQHDEVRAPCISTLPTYLQTST